MVVNRPHSFDHLSFHFPRFLEAFYWRRMSDLRQQPKTKDFGLLDQRQNAPKRLGSVRPVCAGVLPARPSTRRLSPVRIPGGKGVSRHNRAEVAARAVLVSGVNYYFSLVVMHASRFRTANVRNGSASEAHVRNGGAKGCGAALRREVHAVQEVQEARVGTQAARATG